MKKRRQYGALSLTNMAQCFGWHVVVNEGMHHCRNETIWRQNATDESRPRFIAIYSSIAAGTSSSEAEAIKKELAAEIRAVKQTYGRMWFDRLRFSPVCQVYSSKRNQWNLRQIVRLKDYCYFIMLLWTIFTVTYWCSSSSHLGQTCNCSKSANKPVPIRFKL
jgi:hypothetical protein